MYYFGKGTAKNKIIAYALWLICTTNKSNEENTQKINLLGNELTNKEILEAKKLSQKFFSDILAYSIKSGNIYKVYNAMTKHAEIDNTITSEK